MRNRKVDILRFIGLAMIILAHVEPPSMLFQIRNFDVPLMVLVSGMSFGLTYKSGEAYLSYVWRRVKRLVFPVWIFLAIYFIALAILYPDSSELDSRTMINSFLLIKGIGFVWIIKVFLLVALISPWIYRFSAKTESNRRYILIIVGCFLTWEITRYLTIPMMSGGLKTASLITHYIIPYGLVFAVGLRVSQFNNRQLHRFSFISLGALILIGLGLFLIHGKFIPTQKFKYPPSIYYFSYSFLVSFFLLAHSRYLERIFERLGLLKVVLFIAQNTIWIYLWHIPLVKIVNLNFILKYLVVLFTAVIIAYIQVCFVNSFLLMRTSNKRLRKNIATILTG